MTYGVGDLYVDDLSNSSLVRLCGENTVHGVSFGAGDLKEGVRTGKCVEVLSCFTLQGDKVIIFRRNMLCEVRWL